MRPRVIYMGTPDFAVPTLERLAASDLCDVALVVTQPDRPAGRGKKMMPPAVKVSAETLNVPFIQTDSLRHTEVRQEIIDLEPDLIVVAAFGMILGKWILELPPRGCVNLHASLLPKYRGANPIASAIATGEDITGITLMRMDRGLDTGPIYATNQIAITDDATTESLTPQLANLAGDLLEEYLGKLLDSSLDAIPQPAGASLTRMMTKNDGWLDFSRPAVDLERHIRAMWPWPRAWTTDKDDRRIQIHAAIASQVDVGAPGEVERRGEDVHVGTSDGSLILRRIQIPGGKPIEGRSLLQATIFTNGSLLGMNGGPGTVPPLVRGVKKLP